MLKTNVLNQGYRFALITAPNFTIIGELKETGELFLHCTPIRNWSVSTYKYFLECMNIVKDSAKEGGIDTLYAFAPDTFQKFVSMAGFEPVEQFDVDGSYWTLYEQETA